MIIWTRLQSQEDGAAQKRGRHNKKSSYKHPEHGFFKKKKIERKKTLGAKQGKCLKLHQLGKAIVTSFLLCRHYDKVSIVKSSPDLQGQRGPLIVFWASWICELLNDFFSICYYIFIIIDQLGCLNLYMYVCIFYLSIFFIKGVIYSLDLLITFYSYLLIMYKYLLFRSVC